MHPNASANFTLYIADKNLSSWSMRPGLVAKQMGLAFQEKHVKLDRPATRHEILKFSPSGRVPTLKHGELTIWDSLAICEYLAELKPAAHLWPQATDKRAWARAITAEMHSGFAALREQLPHFVFNADTSRLKRITEACERDIARILEIWQSCRTAHAKEGPYLFGHFTIADAFYAPVVIRFTRYGVPLSGAAADFCESILSLPAMKEWIAGAKAEVAKP